MDSPSLENKAEIVTVLVKKSKSYVSNSSVVPELVTDLAKSWSRVGNDV